MSEHADMISESVQTLDWVISCIPDLERFEKGKAALAALEAELAEAQRERDEALDENRGLTDFMEKREAENARLRAALAPIVAAVEPLMASKPDEILPDGRLRYDWTEALYAIRAAVVPARAAFVPMDALKFLEQLIWTDSNRTDIGQGPVFDAIHASPPCQDYSKAMRHLSGDYPRLIDPVRDLLAETSLPWVIENVPGAPIPAQSTLEGRYGVELCGSMFGLRVRRHRLFETSFPIASAPRSCDHRLPAMNPHNQAGRDRIYAEFGRQNPDPIWNAAMGVDWMTKEEGREAIPPAYTEFIGRQLLAHIEVKEAA